jgi:hypothetical protein
VALCHQITIKQFLHAGPILTAKFAFSTLSVKKPPMNHPFTLSF